METFLGNVARSLYDEFGEDISSVRILLPNTRSRLFFLDELGRLIRRPVWQPRYTTVDEVMRSLAGYAPVERVRAVAELYKVYSRYHKEGFDSFYFWGEVLLNDFDQIDKYRVDADMLFSNLRDLKDMDGDLSYFNEQQRAVVRRFWEAFGAEEGYSDEKRDFLSIWRSLRTIYHEFRERLAELGLAYTGMMHRRAAERLRSGEVSADDGRPWPSWVSMRSRSAKRYFSTICVMYAMRGSFGTATTIICRTGIRKPGFSCGRISPVTDRRRGS